MNYENVKLGELYWLEVASEKRFIVVVPKTLAKVEPIIGSGLFTYGDEHYTTFNTNVAYLSSLNEDKYKVIKRIFK